MIIAILLILPHRFLAQVCNSGVTFQYCNFERCRPRAGYIDTNSTFRI